MSTGSVVVPVATGKPAGSVSGSGPAGKLSSQLIVAWSGRGPTAAPPPLTMSWIPSSSNPMELGQQVQPREVTVLALTAQKEGNV